MKKGRPAPLTVAPHAQVELRRQQEQWRHNPRVPNVSFRKSLSSAYKDIKEYPWIGAEFLGGGVPTHRYLMDTQHWLYYVVDGPEDRPAVYVIWIQGTWKEPPTNLRRARQKVRFATSCKLWHTL